MTGSDTIARHEQDPDELDFAALRRQGIASAQALAGKIWTDYNLHDPGVTILEVLCFGLTELAYQTGAPVADFLANEKGQINYSDVALLKPHEAFPSAAVTPHDYCKVLLDQIPELERIEFIPLNKQSTGGLGGCYKVLIKLLEPLTGAPLSHEQRHVICQSVMSLYAQQRNLGEDVIALDIEESLSCYLTGTVETDGSRTSAEIYADIFFQAARKISSDITLSRYEAVAAQGHALADIFTGPLTEHGVIDDSSFISSNTARALEELNSLVTAIVGVKKVHALQLVDAEGNALTDDLLRSNSFHLKYPQASEPVVAIEFTASTIIDTELLVKYNEKHREKFLKDSLRHLQKLEFEYRAFRTNKVNASNFYQLPQASPKQDLDYYSIQHQFPQVYGIGAAGVPSGADIERKAQAAQLKAYLYPFEQLMANYSQLLQQLQSLFSLNSQTEHSYFSEYLDNHNIPQLEALYPQKGLTQHDVQAVQARYDNALSRKNRALDSLLALYGEEFSQEGLLSFNYYHQDAPGYWTIDNKINLLRHIAELSARRSASFNVQRHYWDTHNASSLHKKLAILLGIKNYSRHGSLTNIFVERNINWADDKKLIEVDVQSQSAPEIMIPPLSAFAAKKLEHWRYQSKKALSISPQLLVQGTNLDSYRLVADNSHFSVYLRLSEDSQRIFLNKFSDADQAVLYAHKFKKIITDLNEDSEGFFIVEHLLLRRRVSNHISAPDDFFDSQVSIVFPNWSARFNNPMFQQYAQKMISYQLPAQILPNFYWLDLKAMENFENKYQRWLSHLSAVTLVETSEQLNAAAKNGKNEIANQRLSQHESSSTAYQALDEAAQNLISLLGSLPSSRDYWI